jgi:hypothetical protein
MEVPGIKDAHPLSESERYKGYDIVVFKMPFATVLGFI